MLSGCGSKRQCGRAGDLASWRAYVPIVTSPTIFFSRIIFGGRGRDHSIVRTIYCYSLNYLHANVCIRLVCVCGCLCLCVWVHCVYSVIDILVLFVLFVLKLYLIFLYYVFSSIYPFCGLNHDLGYVTFCIIYKSFNDRTTTTTEKRNATTRAKRQLQIRSVEDCQQKDTFRLLIILYWFYNSYQNIKVYF